jgi:hypothetical protein
MRTVFQARPYSTIRLLTTSANEGRPKLEDYLTAVPVRIRSAQVEVCFLTRWDVNVRRRGAEGKAVKQLPRPGDPGYRRFRNLKLTLDPDEPVFVRRDPGGTEGPEVVISVLGISRGKAEFSISGPSEEIIDLSQIDCREEASGLDARREGSLMTILDRLNHGDAWDREHVL